MAKITADLKKDYVQTSRLIPLSTLTKRDSTVEKH